MSKAGLSLGIDRLLEEAFDLVAGQRLGLITNHSGVDAQLRSTADCLHTKAGTELVALFGPEHGIRGDAADGRSVASRADAHTGVPVYSLYGEIRHPTEEMLRRVDVLLFDIQDVGARFYTYLYTMSLAMQAAAAAGLPFIVLDRPNPIGGMRFEGNLLDPAFASFVGLYPIPVRYGLSIGEIATLFNEEWGINAELVVVEMKGWDRHAYWEASGLPWVPPSPNMPSVDTAVVYPGMCFFEGTNVSEGRGTAKPFEQIGAPYINAHRLCDVLAERQLPGVALRPVCFEPTAGKYVGEACHGIQLHVFDRDALAPVRTGLEILAVIKNLWPQDFGWRVPQGGIHNFDRLAGTDQIRLRLDAGASVDELCRDWQTGLEAFGDVRQRYLRY
jgi:uncharacterized protein YbbC (DUF1343 family)